MTHLYQAFDVDETTPVQFAGVYVTRWESLLWGEPTILFREVDDATQRAADTAPALLKALKALLAAGESGLMTDWYPAREQARAAIAKAERAEQ